MLQSSRWAFCALFAGFGIGRLGNLEFGFGHIGGSGGHMRHMRRLCLARGGRERGNLLVDARTVHEQFLLEFVEVEQPQLFGL